MPVDHCTPYAFSTAVSPYEHGWFFLNSDGTQYLVCRVSRPIDLVPTDRITLNAVWHDPSARLAETQWEIAVQNVPIGSVWPSMAFYSTPLQTADVLTLTSIDFTEAELFGGGRSAIIMLRPSCCSDIDLASLDLEYTSSR